jgi:hypothetical protein
MVNDFRAARQKGKTPEHILLLLVVMFIGSCVHAQDTLQPVTDTLLFKGQLSAWGIYSHHGELPVMTGGRYIPALNFGL